MPRGTLYIDDRRKTRQKAREKILRAANKQRAWLNEDPLNMRHIGRAVRVCRHNKLVGPMVLSQAGFRAS